MNNTAKFGKSDDCSTVTNLYTTDGNESEELFSDDEQKKELKIISDACQDILDLHRPETPLSSINDASVVRISNDPTIPSTPLSLLPFLSKVNEQWTSDLETPQADKSIQPHRTSTGSTKKAEITPKLERTPDFFTVTHTDDKLTSDSPVIVSKRRRKRPKRRCIFKSICMDMSSMINDESTCVQAEASVIPESVDLESPDNITNVAIFNLHTMNDTCKEQGSQILNRSQDIRDNEGLEKSGNTLSNNNLNSSTQEFFNNVSFSCIDQLCSSNSETRTITKTNAKYNSNESNENVNKERGNMSPTFNKAEENVGFFTARGAAINISEEALLKAKMLLNEIRNNELCNEESSVENELDKNDNDVVIKYEKSPIKKNFKQEDISLSSPSTSGFAPIAASRKFLTKMEALFSDQSNAPVKLDATKIHTSAHDKLDTKTVNIGFKTARGAPINISKQALSKAEALFAKELTEPLELNVEEADNYNKEVKKQKIKSPTIGFTTARGTPINISKKALSKAEALFAKELAELSESNFTEEADNYDKEVRKQEIKASTIGFTTARGAPINISEKALSKAKEIFAKELADPLEIHIEEKVSNYSKEVKKQEIKIPTIGFSTARGAPINISEQALAKANTLFADLDCPLERTVPGNVTKECRKFQTRNDQEEAVSNNVLLRPQIVFSNKQLDESNSTHASCVSLQKRKLNLDNGISLLGKTCMSELKRARFGDEFQVKKLFSDNPNTDVVNNDEKLKSEDIYDTHRMIIDDDTNNRYKKSETSCANELSNEIAVVEFDLDEKNRASFTVIPPSRSPEREILESNESKVLGSPVIGRQPISQKRKSLKCLPRNDVLRINQMIQLDTHVIAPRDDSVEEDAPCERLHESELNAGLQRPTQSKRQRTESNSAELTDYGDTQIMMDFIDKSAKILEDRLAAALKQEQTITARRAYKPKRSIGHLYRYKEINSKSRLSLKDVSNGMPPVPRSYQELINRRIPPNILAITAVTAASYKFRCSDFYGDDIARNNVHGIEMEDGARLIMDENGYVGVWEFVRAFLASPGVDPNLVPARWIDNHYRWIVWKLAAMDRMKFGSADLSRALTPSCVMAQLKYRYDREIDRAQRPAIRRILEKDDIASKRIILCVSSIVENSDTTMEIGKSPLIGMLKWKMELTDGWYSIPACIDISMMKNIATGKVKEGTKLLIFGAELLNCHEGCHPLEVPADICLRLYTNSTRRARWYSKLGYMSRSGPIPIKLRNVCPNGGLIGKMTIIIARIYPMLYYERTEAGESIIRNTKCEEKAQIEYEHRCRSKVEAFYAKAENNFQEHLSYETDSIDLLATQSHKGRGNSSIEESLAKKQHDELLQELRTKEERFKEELQSKLRESLPPPRQVSSLLKVRICDGGTNAILSIWSPSEEIVDILKEGTCVSLSNVIASGKRGCELQITARRSAIFNPGIMQDTSYPYRVCTPFCEVGRPEFAPAYGEFDTVGFVCSVGPAPYGMKDFEVVHLAYPKTDSNGSSYLSILFWQGVASYGYAEILTIESIVACNNLEWRRATAWNVPVAYCTDRSIFSRNLRRNHLYESFENLRSLITDPIVYAEKCVSELTDELQKKPMTKTPTCYTPNKNTPNRTYNLPSSSDKKLVDYTPPVSKLSIMNSLNYTPINPSIRKRLDKLLCYSESPDISPIIIKSSKRVSLNFQSPVRNSEGHSTKDTDKPGHSNPSIALEKQ